jgi:hypothetical protein
MHNTMSICLMFHQIHVSNILETLDCSYIYTIYEQNLDIETSFKQIKS